MLFACGPLIRPVIRASCPVLPVLCLLRLALLRQIGTMRALIGLDVEEPSLGIANGIELLARAAAMCGAMRRHDQLLVMLRRCVSVTRMCVPAGRLMSPSFVAAAYAPPAAAPTTAPMIVPLLFLLMICPTIAPAAAPTPTLTASPPLMGRPCRSVARESMLALIG